jgi:hypothetical protein
MCSCSITSWGALKKLILLGVGGVPSMSSHRWNLQCKLGDTDITKRDMESLELPDAYNEQMPGTLKTSMRICTVSCIQLQNQGVSTQTHHMCPNAQDTLQGEPRCREHDSQDMSERALETRHSTLLEGTPSRRERQRWAAQGRPDRRSPNKILNKTYC